MQVYIMEKLNLCISNGRLMKTGAVVVMEINLPKFKAYIATLLGMT